MKSFVPGQRVFGFSSKGGASAEYLALPETAAVAEMPEHLSFDEGPPYPSVAWLRWYFSNSLQT
ncbi:MAG: hypothetical protein AAGB10_20125 [Pseudomonadota bacterium]